MLNPYKLEPSEATDDNISKAFEFTTDKGANYYIYFRDLSYKFKGTPVFDFGFVLLNKTDFKEKIDNRISHTVCSALDSFLFENENVIVYIPLDDAKATNSSRLKLFDVWLKSFKDDFSCKNLAKQKIEINYQDETIRVTLFYKAQNQEIAQRIIDDTEAILDYAVN